RPDRRVPTGRVRQPTFWYPQVRSWAWKSSVSGTAIPLHPGPRPNHKHDETTQATNTHRRLGRPACIGGVEGSTEPSLSHLGAPIDRPRRPAPGQGPGADGERTVRVLPAWWVNWLAFAGLREAPPGRRPNCEGGTHRCCDGGQRQERTQRVEGRPPRANVPPVRWQGGHRPLLDLVVDRYLHRQRHGDNGDHEQQAGER